MRPCETMRLIEARVLEAQFLQESTWLERQLLEVCACFMGSVHGRTAVQKRAFFALLVCKVRAEIMYIFVFVVVVII